MCVWEVGVDGKEGARALLEGQRCVCTGFLHVINGMVLS